jgi:hypothetical protein
MSNSHQDNLFALIKSLSKSEKRQFKLFANRLEVNKEAKFLQLFDLLDKMKDYKEEDILKSKIVKKVQLPNLKNHLYGQILVSLRMHPTNQNIRVQIREQLDFATILYHKGLFKQSLKLLDKVKLYALVNEEKNIAYEIIELEKVIESQYITRSSLDRADQLIEESKRVSLQNDIVSKLSNLSLKLYQIMLVKGYVKTHNELKELQQFFQASLPVYKQKDLGFREKLWIYKTYLWYYFLSQDLVSCYKYALKWVNLFYERPHMIKFNPVWYIKGVNYLLEASFLLNHKTQFKKALRDFEKTTETDLIIKNDNTSILILLCLYTNKLNYHLMNCDFENGLVLKDDIMTFLEANFERIDDHHTMVFYYKIACLYFGLEDYENAILYLEKIVNNKQERVKEELMCFAKILNLISHYEASLDEKLEYQIKSTYSYLLKMDNLQQVQKEMLNFIKTISNSYPSQLKPELEKLHSKLLELKNHPFEKRSFYYLDILSWIESKLQNKPILEIIREKSGRMK